MKIIDRRIDVKEKTNSDEIIGNDLFKYGNESRMNVHIIKSILSLIC